MSSDLEMDMWDRPDFTEQEEFETPPIPSNDHFPIEDYDEEDDEDFGEWLEELEEEESEQSVISNARVRLEQGRLYEMLINHNLFDGVDAMPEAISNVEKEIKDFITERLEILLGMRAEKEVKHVVQESQFNDMEVQALRMVASKITKGASATSPSNEQKTEVSGGLNTLTATKKPQAINKVAKKTVSKKTPLPKKSKGPKKRKRRPVNEIREDMQKINTRDSSAYNIAKKDIDYLKTLENMSLEEANKVVSQRHNRPRPKVEIDQNAVNGLYQQKVAMNNSKISDYAKIIRQVALSKANQN